MLNLNAAMIMVPSNGDYDWMNGEWRDTQQEIEVIQGNTSATVIGKSGRIA
ncbi:hypothetical protein [Paraburkholderia sp. J12]|uniref:hypothetical protein n=1 Tax=Paraburkholderia sp. J12 TaxID=2805432 RepID=UPI002ABD254D|nr:hypothetical protein [Paraburkholderia sp. J12]